MEFSADMTNKITYFSADEVIISAYAGLVPADVTTRGYMFKFKRVSKDYASSLENAIQDFAQVFPSNFFISFKSSNYQRFHEQIKKLWKFHTLKNKMILGAL